jgi:hypothetical protein
MVQQQKHQACGSLDHELHCADCCPGPLPLPQLLLLLLLLLAVAVALALTVRDEDEGDNKPRLSLCYEP